MTRGPLRSHFDGASSKQLNDALEASDPLAGAASGRRDVYGRTSHLGKSSEIIHAGVPPSQIDNVLVLIDPATAERAPAYAGASQ